MYVNPEKCATYEEWIAANMAADPDFDPTPRSNMPNGFEISSEPTPEGAFPGRGWWEHRTSEVYLSGRDADKATAQEWSLHFRVGGDLEAVCVQDVQALANRILRTGAECLTGQYIGGDSFWQWAEIYDHEENPENGRALHIYFTAPNLDEAINRGQAICQAIAEDYPQYLSPFDVTLSTGADWAEQAEVWPRQAQVFI